MDLASTEHSKLCGMLFARPTGKEAGAIYDAYLSAMDSEKYARLMQEFDITTLDRVTGLLATWAHETGGFRLMRESGNYTDPARIVAIFGPQIHSAAVTESEARGLVRNSYALFERVYGLGNPKKAAELGNVKPGDGFLFRGCGIQQLTGRGDHERYSEQIGCSIDALAEPINSMHAALLEWRNKGCNALCDRKDWRSVRKAINGGFNGWEDFHAKAMLIHKALNGGHKSEVYLSLGSRGQAVRELQEKLQARGFYENAAIDDIFGALTQRALVSFQAAQGLPTTGVLDPTTALALQSTPAEPTLPGRKVVEVKDGFIDRLRAVWTAFLGWLGIYEGANQLGFEPAEKVLNTAEKVRTLISKLQVQPRFIAYAFVAIMILVIVRWVKKASDVATEKKQTGKAT